jgi:hypothetical protein
MRGKGRLPVSGAYAIAIVALIVALGGGAYALQGTNRVKSNDIKNGQVRRADISDAAEGARAYGEVSADGTLGNSKGITAVSHPVNGGYCITPAAGIDPTTATLLVDAEFDRGNTPFSSVRYAQQVTSLVQCPAGTLEVVVFDLGIVDGGGIGRADNPFSFAIP